MEEVFPDFRGAEALLRKLRSNPKNTLMIDTDEGFGGFILTYSSFFVVVIFPPKQDVPAFVSITALHISPHVCGCI